VCTGAVCSRPPSTHRTWHARALQVDVPDADPDNYVGVRPSVLLGRPQKGRGGARGGGGGGRGRGGGGGGGGGAGERCCGKGVGVCGGG
jgi:hypothetical protein